MTDVILIFHFGLFFDLSPLNDLKNQNFEKMKKKINKKIKKNKKKTPGDVTILLICTKNYDYMMYSS